METISLTNYIPKDTHINRFILTIRSTKINKGQQIHLENRFLAATMRSEPNTQPHYTIPLKKKKAINHRPSSLLAIATFHKTYTHLMLYIAILSQTTHRAVSCNLFLLQLTKTRPPTHTTIDTLHPHNTYTVMCYCT